MIIFSIIGALIGAGFASGQEIYLFFYRFGICGILGLLLCSILIGIVIYKTFLVLLNKREINNYEDFLNVIFKKNNKKQYLNLGYISSIIVNAFLLITFYIMISGFGAYFEQEFHISSIVGAILLAVLCFIILLKGIDGVTKANSFIVPILIIVILIISIKNIVFLKISRIDVNFNVNWILQAIIYCSYNMILVIPILVELKKYLKSKKQVTIIAILSSIIIFVLAISIFLLLTNVCNDFSKLQMPAVYVIDNSFSSFRVVYGVVILLSIFSTAISIGISFLKNTMKDKKGYPQFVGIMCISGVAISNIGFSNLVELLFPIFGYLGLVQIYYILKNKDG